MIILRHILVFLSFGGLFFIGLFLAHIVVDGNPENYPINPKGFWRWLKKASQPTPAED